jgi:hypothetical protein
MTYTIAMLPQLPMVALPVRLPRLTTIGGTRESGPNKIDMRAERAARAHGPGAAPV